MDQAFDPKLRYAQIIPRSHLASACWPVVPCIYGRVDIFCIAWITERVKFPMIMFCALNFQSFLQGQVSSEFMIEVFPQIHHLRFYGRQFQSSFQSQRATRRTTFRLSFSESTRPLILSTASVSLLILLSTGSSKEIFINVYIFDKYRQQLCVRLREQSVLRMLAKT